jgi:hypothetical protein
MLGVDASCFDVEIRVCHALARIRGFKSFVPARRMLSHPAKLTENGAD